MPPLLLLLVCLPASSAVLYDGSLGTAPSSQGWLYNNPPGATQSLPPGVVRLDTTSASAVQAGYSLFGQPFNLNPGFVLRFDVQIGAESHVSNDRAGFSVIAISNSFTGIELAFWTNEVWAQNAGFTHGEGAAFDTTAAIVRYELFMNLSGYSLYADGSLLLSGALRDYGGIPYDLPGFLFLGDDTTSAQGIFDLARVDLDEVPEPGTMSLALASLGALVALRLRASVLPARLRAGRRPGATPIR